MSLDITSGLYSQIQQLKKRLKALDAAEANPSEITEVSKALEALEARYDKQKESKRVRMEERKKKEADEFNSHVVSLMGEDEATDITASGCDQCSASMINGVFCHETGCPNARKQAPQEDVEMDASTTPQAATTVLALDTRVEPTRGTPGSHGRVMRHDAGSDTVYVMWDGGKLKESHGFGAYSLADLKVQSQVEPTAAPKALPPVTQEPTHEDIQNMPGGDKPVAAPSKANPELRYQQIKKIVDESQHGKVEGQMVDGFTASLLQQIADQLNPENRVKFLSMPMGKMVDVAWKFATPKSAAEETEAVTKEAAEFSSHGNGKGLNDLYILPSSPEEGQKIEQYLKSIDHMFEWSNANVKGHAWYGKRFIEIPFGESLQPEIEKTVGGPVVASLKQADGPSEEGLMGWPNKETWATKLWMDNDSDWFHKSREMAQRAKSPEELAQILKDEMGPLVAEELARRTQEAMSPEKIDWVTVADVLWDEEQTNKGNEMEAPKPEEKDLLDDSPVMDKHKIRETIDKLLEQLHAETDPAKKEQIKQRIKSLKSAGRHPKLNKVAEYPPCPCGHIDTSHKWVPIANHGESFNCMECNTGKACELPEQFQPKASTGGEGPSGVGYGGDRPGVNVAPMRDEDTSLNASKVSKLTVFAKELTVHPHTDKIAYDVFDGEQKILTITPKEALTPEQIEVVVAQEYAKKNVVKAKVTKDLTVLKKGHLVRILALDEKKLHVKFASLESPELTGWAPFTKFEIEAEHGEGDCPRCGTNPKPGKEMCDTCKKQVKQLDKDIPPKKAEFQPKTGEPCSCRPGQQRDNCPACEGTGQKVDFKKIREAKASKEELKHGDHVDQVLGHRGDETLAFCGGKVVWLPTRDMLPTTQPPATPESLNPEVASTKESQDVLSPGYCDKCKEAVDLPHTCGATEKKAEFPGGPCKGCGKELPLVYGETFCKECVDKGLASKPVEKEAGPLCANCGVRFNTMDEYAKHKEEAHKVPNPDKTKAITDRVEKKLSPHLVSKRLGKKDPKYNYDEEMENAEEEEVEASKVLPVVEKAADDMNMPPTAPAPQGMRYAWDDDKRLWILVKKQGL